MIILSYYYLSGNCFYKYASPRTAAMIAKASKIVCNFLDANYAS